MALNSVCSEFEMSVLFQLNDKNVNRFMFFAAQSIFISEALFY